MYTRKNVYRIFAVAMMILTLVAGVTLIVFLVQTLIKAYDLFDMVNSFFTFILAFLSGGSGDLIEGMSAIGEGLQSAFTFVEVLIYVLFAVSIVYVLVRIFMQYVASSSMLNFTNMIKHEESASSSPLVKSKYVLSPNIYRGCGLAMQIFLTCLALGILGSIAVVIFYISSPGWFVLWLIVLAVIFVAVALYAYVQYHVRYKVLGDLQELVTSKQPGERTLERLKKDKSNVLRAYCVVLFVLAIIFTVVAIILVFLIYSNLLSLIGAGYTNIFAACVIAYFAICVARTYVLGLYVDNIAKMLEHYQIKYKLLK